MLANQAMMWKERNSEYYNTINQKIQLRKNLGKKLKRRMLKDPVWTVEKVFRSPLWSKQEEIVQSVFNNPRTAVRSCHGVGKSYIAGRVILAFLYTFHPSIVISTAPTWRQVEKLVWKEVRAAYNGAAIRLGGNLSPKTPELQIKQDEWYAIGLSTNEPDRFQGFHAENILVVVDEAAGVSEDIYEGIEGVLTSVNAKLLLLGNPTSLTGTFRKAFREPGWKTIHISAYDSPNFTKFKITEEDIASGRWEKRLYKKKLPNPMLITPAWVADKYKRWGPDSIAYQARCKGEFPEDADDTLIPLSWIEAAMARYDDTPATNPIEIGVDVARFGSDKTILANRFGRKILPLEQVVKYDTMQVTGKVVEAYRKIHPIGIKVDEIGLGAGVVDRLKEQKFPVIGVNVAESASDKEHFANLRSELWWNLRDMLNPNPLVNPYPLALPADDELLADLSGIKYKIKSTGQIQVESKDDMKKRLGRSPDRGDAVVLAVAPIKDRILGEVIVV